MSKLKNKNTKAILYTLMLLMVFVFPAAAATTISIASQTVSPGGTVTVPIMANGITNVAAYTISLTYTPAVVVVDSVGAGDLGAVTKNINNATGVTQMSAFSTTPQSGNVTLASVTLRAVGTAGQASPLTLTVTTLIDDNGITIPATVSSGTFSITPVSVNGTIAGTVTNAATGSPIAGATVDAASGTTIVASDTTNALGRYSISVAAGSYNMRASATGFTASTITGVVVTSGTTTTQNFALTPTAAANGTIAGTVTDATTGLPIASATVNAGGPGGITTTTGASGAYTISIAPGTYTVTALKTGYTPSSASVTVISGATVTLNIALTPSVPPFVPVTLTVAGNKTAIANGTDTTLLSLVGKSGSTYKISATPSSSNVRFYPNDGGLLPNFTTSISSIKYVGGTSGLFHVAGGNASFNITVTNATNATDTATVTGLSFILGPTGQITGIVKDGAGNGIPGATVNVSSSASGIQIASTTTLTSGLTGSYTFLTVPQGDYSVNAFNVSGLLGIAKSASVVAGQTTGGVDVIMLAVPIPTTKTDTVTKPSIPADGLSSTTITATILDQNGKPMPGVTVKFTLKNGTLDVTTGFNGTPSSASGSTDGNGQVSYVLTSGLNPGTVVVYNEVSGTPTVNNSVTITFTPLQGHVTGTVRSSENVPLAGAQVVVSRLNLTSNVWEPVMVAGQQKSTITVSDGSYTLAFIPVLVDVNHNVPRNGESGNTILLEASKVGYNNGSLITWISSAGRTAEGNDIVMTTGQPDQIYVSVDNSVHQVLDSPVKIADGVSTWSVTAQLMKSGVNAGIAGQSITFAVDNPSVATLSSTTAVTDATGKATVTLTSTFNPGTVKATGSFLTRDNLLLTDFDYAKSQGVAQLSGIVTNENQTQLPGALVTLYLDKYGNGTVFVPAVDINGNTIPSKTTPFVGPTTYTFTAVPSGIYKVTATLSGQSGFAYPVIVTSGTTTANVVIVGGVVPIPPALVSAVTPNSRNAQIGVPVTVFMSVINVGGSTATGVTITQAPPLEPVTISYQQWNGATLIGAPNTPVDIPAGGTVNYVLTITPTSAFSTSPLTFNVASTNGVTAPISAVNTLTLSASPTLPPDVIMMSTSLDVRTGVNTPKAFAVATSNVGATATGVSFLVQVPSSITGLAYQVNQTNPTTGAIIGPATGLTINSGAQPTFAVFLTPTQPIALDLANNRITLQLVDGTGKVIGAQSVAVSTT